MRNKDLKKIYNKIYKKGEDAHYTSLILSGDKVPPAKAEVLKEISWRGKTVLDAGCGTGELAYLIAKKGARKAVGIDYSKEAIEVAQKKYRSENLVFRADDISNIRGKFDVVVSLGTLEHLNDPVIALRKLKSLLAPGGSLIITCPNWSNPRGYILVALKLLFDAKITLADLHYFTPLEFQKWAKKLKMKLSWKTFEQSWGHGEKMIKDFEKRLPNVLLKDKGFKTDRNRISVFLEWLKYHAVLLEKDVPCGGAVALYHLQK